MHCLYNYTCACRCMYCSFLGATTLRWFSQQNCCRHCTSTIVRYARGCQLSPRGCQHCPTSSIELCCPYCCTAPELRVGWASPGRAKFTHFGPACHKVLRPEGQHDATGAQLALLMVACSSWGWGQLLALLGLGLLACCSSKEPQQQQQQQL
jgi:hypothetical protein